MHKNPYENAGLNQWGKSDEKKVHSSHRENIEKLRNNREVTLLLKQNSRNETSDLP